MSKYSPRRNEDTLEIIILIVAIIVGVTLLYMFVLKKKDAEPPVLGSDQQVAETAKEPAKEPETIEPEPKPEPRVPQPPRREPEPPTTESEVTGNVPPTADIAEVDKLLAGETMGDLMTARATLTKMLLAAENAPERPAIKKRLDALNQRLFFSPLPTPDSTIYTIQKGDSLWRIKNKFRSSVELIKRINSRSTNTVRAGQTLKIPKGAFSILVNREKYWMIVFLEGHYIKEYPIGIGKGSLTPAGEFTVEVMATNPQWTNPDNGKVYTSDSPENPLGTRWIGFAPKDGRSGLGIHGTSEPDSIGTKCSRGCVRMLNKDVEELYSMMNRGDTVVIK